jgi:hypothetical protein
MRPRWKTVEEQVRDIASRLYGKPCEPGRIAGNDLDGIIDIAADQKALFEITVNTTLEKVRNDLNKLAIARTALFSQNILVRGFVVIDRPPTVAMTDAAKELNLTVMSKSRLAQQFLDFGRYKATREISTFGSAVDPFSGKRDTVPYVPVTYIGRESRKTYTVEQISEMLLEGKNLVLLGEYGSGKSRCINEIFLELSKEWDLTFQFPIAVNLRDCWGLRRAEEIVRRHVCSLGLDDMQGPAVRAYNSQNLLFLLDGFDEIGIQAWSIDDARLKELRAQALSGVKEVVLSSGTGTLVAGREHYFTNQSEMFAALGLAEKNTVVIQVKEQFSLEEMSEYFEAAEIDVVLPDWLPRRPLICQTIASLDRDELGSMFGLGSREAAFWNHFMKVICQRDSRINPLFDPDIIYQVFIELSRTTRNKPNNVGPLSERELQEAFTAVVGQFPVEDAAIMLQRLPTLSRVSPETTERRFIDTYILDGLRAKDVSRLVASDEPARNAAMSTSWSNPLATLGQKVLALDIEDRPDPFKQFAKRAAGSRNGTLTGDIVASFLRVDEDVLDFEDIVVKSATVSELDMSSAAVHNLTVEGSIIDKLILPNTPPVKTVISDCVVAKVAGVSSMAGLPKWVDISGVEEFDSVQTVAQIRNAGLAVQHEIFVAIIKKTFFQKGSGRKEEALIRGFGSGPAQGLAPKVLNLLLREKILDRFKGEEGWVYSPNRGEAGRMKAILEELRSSSDPLWDAVGKL